MRITRHIATLAQKLNRLRGSGAVVLYYHGVAERIIDPVMQGLHMPLEDFERQIQYLRKEYTIISMEEFAQNFHRRQLRGSHLVLTFDDGYRNNLTVAAPFLKSLDLPFTVFISTEHIETGRRLPGYYIRASTWFAAKEQLTVPSLQLALALRTPEQRLAAIALVAEKLRDVPESLVEQALSEIRAHIPDSRWSELDEMFSTGQPMTWDEVRTLHSQGATIGSHCHSHSILHPYQPVELVREQVEASKSLITRHLGECRYFAYPHGTIRDIASAAYTHVKAAYEFGFSTVSSPVYASANPHLIPRIGTPNDLNLLLYAIAVSHLNGRKYRKWSQTLPKAA